MGFLSGILKVGFVEKYGLNHLFGNPTIFETNFSTFVLVPGIPLLKSRLQNFLIVGFFFKLSILKRVKENLTLKKPA